MAAERRTVAFVVAPLLLAVAIAWLALANQERADERARLDATAAGLARSITTQIERFGELGLDLGAPLALLDEIDATSYGDLLASIEVEQRFDALYGVSLVEEVERDQLDAFLAQRGAAEAGWEVHRDAGADTLKLITQVFPRPRNVEALGTDVTSLPASLDAAERSWASGRPALSGMTRIVQLSVDEPGAVLYVPLAAGEGRSWLGMVLAGDSLLAVLEPLPAPVSVRLVDPDGVDFQQFGWHRGEPTPDAMVASAPVDVFGNDWMLEAATTPGFITPWTRRGSTLLLVFAPVAILLLGALVWTLATREGRARHLVEVRTRELEELNEALEAANLTKDQFLATVSHELRTPLTVIAGFAESLRRMRPDDPTVAELLAPIDRNVRRLDVLVDDLLTLASLDAGAARALREAVELGPVLRTAPEELAGLDGDEVDVHVDGDLRALVDRRHLERILANLLCNAGRHGAPPIELQAQGDGEGRIRIELRDHGPGIDVDDEDVFSRFVRGSGARHTIGSGLGLAIVRELVGLNGGEVRYESADPGARFVLCLDAVPDEA